MKFLKGQILRHYYPNREHMPFIINFLLYKQYFDCIQAVLFTGTFKIQ